MPLYTYLGQLLVVGTALATSQACCCSSSSSSSSQSSSSLSSASSSDTSSSTLSSATSSDTSSGTSSGVSSDSSYASSDSSTSSKRGGWVCRSSSSSSSKRGGWVCRSSSSSSVSSESSSSSSSKRGGWVCRSSSSSSSGPECTTDNDCCPPGFVMSPEGLGCCTPAPGGGYVDCDGFPKFCCDGQCQENPCIECQTDADCTANAGCFEADGSFTPGGGEEFRQACSARGGTPFVGDAGFCCDGKCQPNPCIQCINVSDCGPGNFACCGGQCKNLDEESIWVFCGGQWRESTGFVDIPPDDNNPDICPGGRTPTACADAGLGACDIEFNIGINACAECDPGAFGQQSTCGPGEECCFGYCKPIDERGC